MDKKTKSDKSFQSYLDSQIGPILQAETEDWRELATFAQVTPADLEDVIQFLPEQSQEMFRGILESYKKDAMAAVDEIVGKVPFWAEMPPKKDWLEFFWTRPIFERKDSIRIVNAFLSSKGLANLLRAKPLLYKESHSDLKYTRAKKPLIVDFCRERILAQFSKWAGN